jgi:glycosyltransferase involved in cell wall biosynthesis
MVSTPPRPEGAPIIDPLPDGIRRPFWSVMIPTYNTNRYLKETLESILVQDPGQDEMQIEIVDDCSTEDDPETLLEEMSLTSRVKIFRHPEHVGITANWNACVERATGRWVHILHADDIVQPGFYAKLRQPLGDHPEAGAAFCRAIYMWGDGNWFGFTELERRTPGILADWLQIIAVEQRIQTPAVVVKRETYEKLGGYCCALRYTPDWEMWKRIAVFYPVWYEPEPLACYRVHAHALSRTITRTAMDTPDERKCIEITRRYLPNEVAEVLSTKALELSALRALNEARGFLYHAHYSTAAVKLRQAVGTSRGFAVAKALVRLTFWFANVRRVRRAVEAYQSMAV